MSHTQESWDRLRTCEQELADAIARFMAERYDYEYRVRGGCLDISKETALREARERVERECERGINESYLDLSHEVMS